MNKSVLKNSAYEQGFIDKCAEHNVDPVKLAQWTNFMQQTWNRINPSNPVRMEESAMTSPMQGKPYAAFKTQPSGEALRSFRRGITEAPVNKSPPAGTGGDISYTPPAGTGGYKEINRSTLRLGRFK